MRPGVDERHQDEEAAEEEEGDGRRPDDAEPVGEPPEERGAPDLRDRVGDRLRPGPRAVRELELLLGVEDEEADARKEAEAVEHEPALVRPEGLVLAQDPEGLVPRARHRLHGPARPGRREPPRLARPPPPDTPEEQEGRDAARGRRRVDRAQPARIGVEQVARALRRDARGEEVHDQEEAEHPAADVLRVVGAEERAAVRHGRDGRAVVDRHEREEEPERALAVAGRHGRHRHERDARERQVRSTRQAPARAAAGARARAASRGPARRPTRPARGR